MTDDDQLLGRLRQISLVDIDALTAGTSGERYERLLTAFAGDVHDALDTARGRMADLVREASGGADPLVLIDLSLEMRRRERGREAAERSVQRLQARAQASRALARLCDASAPLLAVLFEVDRRRTGG